MSGERGICVSVRNSNGGIKNKVFTFFIHTMYIGVLEAWCAFCECTEVDESSYSFYLSGSCLIWKNRQLQVSWIYAVVNPSTAKLSNMLLRLLTKRLFVLTVLDSYRLEYALAGPFMIWREIELGYRVGVCEILQRDVWRM